MDINVALDNIKYLTRKFAKEELECIRNNRDIAIETLLEYIRKPVENIDNLPEDYDAHLYAMFILAEFREHRAFDYLIRYLELDEDTIEFFLGDALCDDFPSILASVSDVTDVPKLKAIADNASLDIFVRDVAFRTILVMCVENIYYIDDLSAYIGTILDRNNENSMYLGFIVSACMDMGITEHNEKILSLFDDDKIDRTFIKKDDFTREMDKADQQLSLVKLRDRSYCIFVNDTEKSFGSWVWFNEKQIMGTI